MMESSVERDDLVMDIVTNALQQPGGGGEGYLCEVCKGDEALFREVAEALAWEHQMGSFLLKPWTEFTKLTSPFRAGELVEDRFEIVREVGEGGMGIVYEALDHKRNLRIAIK